MTRPLDTRPAKVKGSMPFTLPWNNICRNLRFLLKKRNIAYISLAERYRNLEKERFPPTSWNSNISPETNRRRVTRLCNGETRVSLQDLWILSQILEIDPATLAYASSDEIIRVVRGQNEKQRHFFG